MENYESGNLAMHFTNVILGLPSHGFPFGASSGLWVSWKSDLPSRTASSGNWRIDKESQLSAKLSNDPNSARGSSPTGATRQESSGRQPMSRSAPQTP